MTPHQYNLAVKKLIQERNEWRDAAYTAVESLRRLQEQVLVIRKRLASRRMRLRLPKGPR